MKAPLESARSIRYAGVVLMICAVSAVQACSGDAFPTAPQSVSRGPAGTSAEVRQVRISGTVTNDEGAPVSGVIVKVFHWTATGSPVSAVSDGSGLYNVSISSNDGFSLVTQKDGYVSAWQSHRITNERELQLDIRIFRILRKNGGN